MEFFFLSFPQFFSGNPVFFYSPPLPALPVLSLSKEAKSKGKEGIGEVEAFVAARSHRACRYLPLPAVGEG